MYTLDYVIRIRREQTADVPFPYCYPTLAYVRDVDDLRYVPEHDRGDTIREMLLNGEIKLRDKYTLHPEEYVQIIPNKRTGRGRERKLGPAHFKGVVEIPEEVLNPDDDD